MQRPIEAGANFFDVEINARAVALDDLRHAHFDRLEGGETLVATHAFAATTNRVAGLGDTRVDHLRFKGATKRALHGRKLGGEERKLEFIGSALRTLPFACETCGARSAPSVAMFASVLSTKLTLCSRTALRSPL